MVRVQKDMSLLKKIIQGFSGQSAAYRQDTVQPQAPVIGILQDTVQPHQNNTVPKGHGKIIGATGGNYTKTNFYFICQISTKNEVFTLKSGLKSFLH